jgi:hypothetical protein
MFMLCGTAAGQSGATIQMTSSKCSNSGCTIDFAWNDPNNPWPPDTLFAKSECCGEFGSFSGNSGTGEAYDVSPFASPVVFYLENAQGQWIAEMWCYVYGNGQGINLSCE